jgi:hypothetical protein
MKSTRQSRCIWRVDCLDNTERGDLWTFCQTLYQSSMRIYRSISILNHDESIFSPGSSRNLRLEIDRSVKVPVLSAMKKFRRPNPQRSEFETQLHGFAHETQIRTTVVRQRGHGMQCRPECDIPIEPVCPFLCGSLGSKMKVSISRGIIGVSRAGSATCKLAQNAGVQML